MTRDELRAESSPADPRPKASFLGEEFAEQFRDLSVVRAYRFRPPYPETVLEKLLTVVQPAPGVMLDVGCGPGEVARRIADRVGRIDAGG